MNTISKGMQAEASRIFNESVVGKPDVKAVVFTSSKPDNFIAGADIDMVQLRCQNVGFLVVHSLMLLCAFFICAAQGYQGQE
jgi:enoyl-CoA hydratase/carnithine racemase